MNQAKDQNIFQTEQWKYLFGIFPIIDIGFGLLCILLSQNWVYTLCLLPVFPIVASSIFYISDKMKYENPGYFVLLINGAFYFLFQYVSGVNSPGWCLMINIIVGASFMFKRAIIGQILVGILAVLTGLFLYNLGATWENSTMITFILLAFTILFSRAHSYLNLQQERIQNKNREIERKNKEITDSINYGKRIQSALQKKVDRVDSSVFPDVILYRPKDIVSGDFYWKFQQGDHFYFCVADCTGHGIPGAFMSVLGLSFLQEIMSRNDSPMPHEILNQLREKIANELSQSDDINASKDGMDASVIRIHSKTLVMDWSGANNGLYLLRNGRELTGISSEHVRIIQHDTKILYELLAQKMPVGYTVQIDPFLSQTTQLHEGDKIYLYSDGYADQFGGPNGKKYKSATFKKFLLDIYETSLEDQLSLLEREHDSWKGSQEQVDDICTMGITILQPDTKA